MSVLQTVKITTIEERLGPLSTISLFCYKLSVHLPLCRYDGIPVLSMTKHSFFHSPRCTGLVTSKRSFKHGNTVHGDIRASAASRLISPSHP